MSGRLTPGATRSLSQGEKVFVLRNQVRLLEDEIADMERQIQVFVDDNAEMDFLSSVNERARTPEVETLYRANIDRIADLRGRITGALNDIGVYRRVLEERFGVSGETEARGR